MSTADLNISNVNLPQKATPSANKLEQLAKNGEKAKLVKAAKEFEGVFMNLVMKSMRDTVPDSGSMGDNSNVKFFQSMLDEEFSKISTQKQGLHLADAIVRQLSARLPKEQPAVDAKKDAVIK